MKLNAILLLLVTLIAMSCQTEEVRPNLQEKSPFSAQDDFIGQKNNNTNSWCSGNSRVCDLKEQKIERMLLGMGRKCKSWTPYAYVTSSGEQIAPPAETDNKLFFHEDGTVVEIDFGIKYPVPGDTVDYGTWEVRDCGKTISLMSRNFGPLTYEVVQFSPVSAVVKYPWPLPGPYQGEIVSVYVRANREDDSPYCTK